MEQIHQDGKAGFVGGCFVSIIKSVAIDNVIETIVYAAIGTVVSFIISMLLRYLASLFKKR
ncbi:hypothetical protein [Labilibacter marinus]|uniref:hypothetical protein n=1 Tax=Labilibacter marinus TaxID=1477105 RepID=UPI00094F60EA|nr:hypothetical protein [Labilibacter marinus]